MLGGCGKPEITISTDMFLEKRGLVNNELDKLNKNLETCSEAEKTDIKEKKKKISKQFWDEFDNKTVEWIGNVYEVKTSADGKAYFFICMYDHHYGVMVIPKDEEEAKKLYRKKTGTGLMGVIVDKGEHIVVRGTAKRKDSFVFGSKKKADEMEKNDKKKYYAMCDDMFKKYPGLLYAKEMEGVKFSSKLIGNVPWFITKIVIDNAVIVE